MVVNSLLTFRLSRQFARRGLISLSLAASLFAVLAASAAAQAPAPSAPAPAQPALIATPAIVSPATGATQSQQTSGTSNDRRTSNTQNRTESTSAVIQQAPTEFQRLILDSINSPLPIFGADLFNNVPDTFAHLDDIPVGADYVIGPGDELRIQVFGQVNTQGSFTVDRTGDISFPSVGTLHVAGVRYDQLGAFLKSQLDRVYRNFDLTVNLGQLR